ncbi:MAG: hypothetical protein O2782_23735, partial [bacterium]|nr:hypothetical protein [bacterium]
MTASGYWRSLLLAGLVPLLLLQLSCTDRGVDPAGTTAAVDVNPQTDETINEMTDNMLDHDAKLRFLAANFDPLPEKMVGIGQDSSIYAQYAQPTDRYGHGILGDAIEAGQLVVLREGISLRWTPTFGQPGSEVKVDSMGLLG